ncbi:DUF6301 family protein [Nocardia salmonicida]|uniref:DUF6301 family protein n=1 Tax=Nocardia salmonicida TaxID=53431 RepID=UPI0037B6D484
MDRKRALTDDEITDLATSLRALQGARPVDTLPELAAEFGWRVHTADVDGGLIDVGFGLGPASGRVFADEGQIVDITLSITKGAADDAEGLAWSRDVFTRMAAALSTAFGDPTARIPGKIASLRWAGAANTLVLRNVEGSLELSLMDNTWLATEDKVAALDAQDSH